MWYVILLAVCIGGDQLLKWWVTSHLDVGQSAPLLPGIVRLTRLHNTGAAWSSFSGKTGLLAAVTIVTNEGSTPRTAGSKMLVFADGSIAGTVGGGLGEGMAITAARQTLAAIAARQRKRTRMNLFRMLIARSGYNGIGGFGGKGIPDFARREFGRYSAVATFVNAFAAQTARLRGRLSGGMHTHGRRHDIPRRTHGICDNPDERAPRISCGSFRG